GGAVLCDMFFFFFQAEDGIRYWSVTGVQTCALPIFPPSRTAPAPGRDGGSGLRRDRGRGRRRQPRADRELRRSGRRRRLDDESRSEERRVGKGRRSRGAPDA